jgi:alpha-L-rhamnosidase
MNTTIWKNIFILLLALVSGICSAAVTIKDLRCEYLTDPLGIDATSPRLGWIITSNRRGETQTAYQILVASSPDLLSDGKADL